MAKTKLMRQKDVLKALNEQFGGIWRIRGKNAYGDGTPNSFNVDIDPVAARYGIEDMAVRPTYRHKFGVSIEEPPVKELESLGYVVEPMNLLTWAYGYLTYVITKAVETPHLLGVSERNL